MVSEAAFLKGLVRKWKEGFIGAEEPEADVSGQRSLQ